MTEQTTIDLAEALPAGELAEQALEGEQQQRDYEAEARKHGWRPKDEFKGEPARWTDAETFVKRADEVMPFLEKKTKAQQREIDDLKRTLKQFQAYVTTADKRAMERATAEIMARHEEAVETGDTAAAKKAIADLDKVKEDYAPEQAEPLAYDPDTIMAEWTQNSPWYRIDDKKTAFANEQADLMKKAELWPGGLPAWLEELDRRVERKFAQPKPSATNTGGTRPGARGNSRGYNDLPPDAKRVCDRFTKTIPGFTKEQYVRDFDWN
jgi:hypothetical protein